MAELIDRKPIIKRVKRFAEYEWNGSRKQAYMEFLDMLTDAPTTTEAEIRAMAIDEFAEKIRDWQKEVYKNDRYAGELDFLFKHIYEISEQLKEEQE